MTTKEADTHSDFASWKQHFPTYQIGNSEFAIEEYRLAAKALESEERMFLSAANLSVLIAVALGSLLLGSLEKIFAITSPTIPVPTTAALIVFVTFAFSVIALLYFADRQKSIVFASRKIIVVRRNGGISYGPTQLVLPSWRIEGADDPFSIRMFPGWASYVSYPCLTIAGVSTVVIFFITAFLINQRPDIVDSLPGSPDVFLGMLAVAWFVVLCVIYRFALKDLRESNLLIATSILAKVLNLKLKSDFQYVFYRAILAKFETERMGIQTTRLKSILIQIEDKEFKSHRGISYKGIGRMVLSSVRLHRKSGGSTITQQLARSLFIVDLQKLVRRKIVEILLALWLDRAANKNEILDLYLSAVRFDNQVHGVTDAMHHYFGSLKKEPTDAECFFLIERLSNVRSGLLPKKIASTIRSAIVAGVIRHQSILEILSLYEKAISDGLVIDPDESGIKTMRELLTQLAEEGNRV